VPSRYVEAVTADPLTADRHEPGPLRRAARISVFPAVVGGAIWPQHWPLLAQLGLALVVGELPGYGLLVLLGCSEAILALFTLVTAVHGIFQHANLEVRLGPLNHFFSMAELHRWHHSETLHEANHNYGQTIILRDTLFGTRFLPRDREPPEAIGIPGLEAFPMTWWAQIKSPFTWRDIRSRSHSTAAARHPTAAPTDPPGDSSAGPTYRARIR